MNNPNESIANCCQSATTAYKRERSFEKKVFKINR